MKEAAIAAHLDDNRAALLTIAKEPSTAAQLAKIKQLSTPSAPRRKKSNVGEGEKPTLKSLTAEWKRAKRLRSLYSNAPSELQDRFVRETLEYRASTSTDEW